MDLGPDLKYRSDGVYVCSMYDAKPDFCDGPDEYCGPRGDRYYCYCFAPEEEPEPSPKKLTKKPRKSRAGTRKKPRCRYCRLPMKGHPRFTCGYDYNDVYPQHYDF